MLHDISLCINLDRLDLDVLFDVNLTKIGISTVLSDVTFSKHPKLLHESGVLKSCNICDTFVSLVNSQYFDWAPKLYT